MAGNTPYHAFNKYDRLESWDYNPDFDKIDQRLELRGSLADRPSTAPDGAKFVVDDPNDAEHGAVYIYDSGNSTWDKQPVDATDVTASGVTAESVDADSADADETYIGNDASFSPAGRPITSNESRTITVGTDVATIQEALNEIPWFPRHKHVIDIPDGDYNEHLITPEFVAPYYRDGRNSGTFMVRIVGNTTTPSNVTVNSISVSGASGSGIDIQGIQTTGEIQVDNEGTGIFIGWSNYALVKDCEIRNATNGIVCYASHLHVNSVDFGANSIADDGLWTKKGGMITEQSNAGCSGNVGGTAYLAGLGRIIADRSNSTLTGDVSLAGGNSIVFDAGDSTFLTGPLTFRKRVYTDDGFQLPNNQALMGTDTGGGRVDTIQPCNSNDRVEIKANQAPDGALDVTGGDGIQLRVVDGGGFGMRSAVDLSSRTGNFVGEIQRNDGTTGGVGHYEWDGSNWQGIGAQSGSTI